MVTFKKILSLLTVLLLLVPAAACTWERPPEDGTPWPENHNGEFTSEYGTLRFNGDGTSISFDLTEEFAEAIGLPQASGEGSYVFIFRNEQWRYDKAEVFRIIFEGQNYPMQNVWNGTTSEKIEIQSPFDDGGTIVFQKKTD